VELFKTKIIEIITAQFSKDQIKSFDLFKNWRGKNDINFFIVFEFQLAMQSNNEEKTIHFTEFNAIPMTKSKKDTNKNIDINSISFSFFKCYILKCAKLYFFYQFNFHIMLSRLHLVFTMYFSFSKTDVPISIILPRKMK